MKVIYNTPQAATYLGVKPGTLEAWRVRGGGPEYIKLGKAVRYRQEALDAFLLSHTRTNTSQIISTTSVNISTHGR